MDSNSTSDTTQKKPNWVLIGVIALIAAVLLAVVLGVFGDNQSSEKSSISGHVDFNGIQPDPEAGNASGNILAREFGSGEEFTDTNATITIGDRVNWVWDGAESGTTYEIKADIYYKDTFVKSSSTASVTSPATNVVLTFNITIEDLPDVVVEDVPASISGAIGINGYIPSGTTVTVLEKPVGSEAYKEVLTGLPASDPVDYSWDEAQIGREYELKSQLVLSGEVIGESDPIRAVAPADHEDMHIDSAASAPQPTPAQADITGTVQINGAVVQDSTLLMLAKLPSEAEYTEFDRFPAADGLVWTFKGVTGQKYNITSALQVEKENVASSNVINATAPAKDELLVINSGLSLTTPTKAPTVSCGDADGTGNFNAEVVIPYVDNAQRYYSIVGTSPGADDTASELLDATPQSDAVYKVYVEKDKDYYTQYAYSYCSTCQASDKQNWSSGSPTTGFKCPS